MRRKFRFDLSWQVVFACSMLLVVLLYCARLIAPLRADDLLETYGFAAIIAMAAVYFYNEKLTGPVEVKLFIFYVVWMLISRWLNRDFYLLADFSIMADTVYSFLLFALGSVLEHEQWEKLLDIFCLIYILFFALASLAGIFVILTGTYIHLPPENVWITMISAENMNSLNMLSSHRLISAARVFSAWALLVYQLFKRKSVPVRIAIVFCIIVFHLTIPLFHSRNIQIVLSGCYGMLALLIMLKKFPTGKNRFIRSALFSAVTIGAAAVCFLSFSWINAAFSDLRASVAPRFAACYDTVENRLDPEYFGITLSENDHLPAAEGRSQTQEDPFSLSNLTAYINSPPASRAFSDTKENGTEHAGNILSEYAEQRNDSVSDARTGTDFSDSRNVFKNKTLTGRTHIWKSAFIAIRQHPSIAVFGSLNNDIMPLINRILREQVNPSVVEYKTHMHNMFMQSLMLTGFPGVLIVVLWTFAITGKMIKLFFSDREYIPAAEKALTILIAGMLVFNLAEVVIFSKLDICGQCFFVVTGIFLADYYDCFPEAENLKVREKTHSR